MKTEYLELCRTHIHREGLEEFLSWLEQSDFFVAPASTRFHGNYEGGLLEHSLNVYHCMKRLSDTYPEFCLEDESIAICALFHDICKANYYVKGFRNKKDDKGQWHQVETYEVSEKFPIGHGEKSCIILQWFFKKISVDELLAIRWHMGEYDSAVKGGDYGLNNAYDKCPIAVILHLADMEASHLLESKKE